LPSGLGATEWFLFIKFKYINLLMKKYLLALPCLLCALTAMSQINVNFNIDATTGLHTISPLIYGSNGQSVDWGENITSRRLGGDRLTGYNWENNFSNAGTDYLNESDNYLPYNMNLPQTEYLKPNAVYNAFHDTSVAMGCYTVLTLPMAGYVAADGNGVVGSGETAPSPRWKTVVNQKGSAFSIIPDTTDDSVYVDECINNLMQHYGPAESLTGVKAYEMDNEWAIWNSTHPRIHPLQPTIAEAVSKSTNLAKTIKITDSTAAVFGPADYGYASFLQFQSAPDWNNYSAYGNFMNAYLYNMKLQSDTFGKRLLDVLSVHWYPEAQGETDSAGLSRVTNGSTDRGVAIARMQCPRTLWDSTYIENSWIGQYYSPCTYVIALQNGIAQYNPGTKLAFTEFDYGAANHISGGIATADVLGIFGKYDVYFGSHWGPLTDYLAAAYRLYRNYDGHNSTFGNTHIQAVTTDIVNSSVYAATESADSNVLHIIAMNKNYDSTVVATFNIAAGTPFDTVVAWAFDSFSDSITIRGSMPVVNNQFAFSIAPLSAYHFVLRRNTVVPTGLSRVNPDFGLTIFPNPLHQSLNIITTLSRFTYRIIDLAGQQVLSGNTVRQIDVSSLSAGMFFIEVMNTDNGYVVTRKFVKD
jgi:mannan endo-1,4-beta-mannosidase